jgi:hypothetical protein
MGRVGVGWGRDWGGAGMGWGRVGVVLGWGSSGVAVGWGWGGVGWGWGGVTATTPQGGGGGQGVVQQGGAGEACIGVAHLLMGGLRRADPLSPDYLSCCARISKSPRGARCAHHCAVGRSGRSGWPENG